MTNVSEWLDSRDARDHFVYVIGHLNEATYEIDGPTKVGISHHPLKRMKQIQRDEPNILVLVATFGFWKRAHARRVEKAFHRAAEGFRERGEWFDIAPSNAVGLMACNIEAFVETVLRPEGIDDRLSAYDYIGMPTMYAGIGAGHFAEALQ